MSVRTQPPETDLIIPLPGEGDAWDPHTIHTHYFGFCVPEAQIGTFLYVRYQPSFGLCQGGVLAFQGLDNLVALDMAHHDYEITMPWPRVEGRRITTANGLCLEFLELGRQVRITYRSDDDACAIDVTATAVTPLVARGHVCPGEDLHRAQDPGGSEQFMHYAGEILLHGERHEVDCHYARDRSWRQVRRESRTANRHPPITWTPVWFGDDLSFNQIGFEDPAGPLVAPGAYDLPEGAPTHHFAWVCRHGEVREVARVRRVVTEYHPLLFAPLRMELEIEDAAGDIAAVRGEAIAMTPIPQWPNFAVFDSVFRWEDEHGRVAYGTAQTAWNDRVQHTLKARRGAVAA